MSAWRARVTSPAAARAALEAGRPLVALRRLLRCAVVAVRRRVRRAQAESSLLMTAFQAGPLGPASQYARRATRVCRDTSSPRWRETLELQLPSRTVAPDGSLSGDTVAPFTRLRLELWDHDYFSHDDFIGEVTIPLTPLMDGRRHRYTLPLTDPEGAFAGLEAGMPLTGDVTVHVSLES